MNAKQPGPIVPVSAEARIVRAPAHSPAPWSYDEEYGLISDADGNAIGTVDDNMTYGRESANGKLLAAAPKLLDALRGLLEEYQHIHPTDPKDAVNVARAAIAEATQ